MSRAFAFSAVAVLATIASVSCGARSELNDRVNEIGDAGDAGPEASVPCIPGNFTLKKAQPSVMFVLDASGSMSETFSPDGSSRWQVLTQSLGSALPSVDSSMQIGGLIFPSGHSPNTCAVPASADLAPATGNVAALIDLMQGTDPLGGTPTADAIATAATELLGIRAASAARAIVLATDGGPNCNPNLDKTTCTCADPVQTQCGAESELCLDDTRTVQTISDNASAGLPTYVIGIHDPGDTQNDTVLNAMADAGGRARSGSPHYYPATSASDLGDALVSIRDQLGSCTYLTSSVPSASGTITVTVGGVVIPY
ncbi:MAG: VWA domain-containing protein, partial [Polyangiaceae bacterium]